MEVGTAEPDFLAQLLEGPADLADTDLLLDGQIFTADGDLATGVLDAPGLDDLLQGEASSVNEGGDFWLPDNVSFSMKDSAALDQLLESLAEPYHEPCGSYASGCGCTSDAATHVVSSRAISGGGRSALFGGESSGWCHPALCEPEIQSTPQSQEQERPQITQRQRQQARGHSGSGSGSDEVMWEQTPMQSGSPTQSGASNASATRAPTDRPPPAAHSCHDASCHADRYQTVSVRRTDVSAGPLLPPGRGNGDRVGGKHSSNTRSSCGSPLSSNCDGSAPCGSATQQSAAVDAKESGVQTQHRMSNEGGANSLLPPGMALAPLQQQSQDLLSKLLQQQQQQQQ